MSLICTGRGVASCLRIYYEMIRNMIEGAWIMYLRKINQQVLGEATDLREFLFGAERAAYDDLKPALMDLQQGYCFYCHNRIKKDSQVHLDHFIPWSRYPTDFGHNFVIADAGCNSAKTDFLAAEEHLERWALRNQRYYDDLNRLFKEQNISHNDVFSISIARWAYRQTDAIGGSVWVRGRVISPLTGRWKELLPYRKADDVPVTKHV